MEVWPQTWGTPGTAEPFTPLPSPPSASFLIHKREGKSFLSCCDKRRAGWHNKTALRPGSVPMLLSHTYCEENSPKKSGSLPKGTVNSGRNRAPPLTSAPNLCISSGEPRSQPKGHHACGCTAPCWCNLEQHKRYSARPKVEDLEKEDGSLLDRASPGCEGSKPGGSWGFSNVYDLEQK